MHILSVNFPVLMQVFGL